MMPRHLGTLRTLAIGMITIAACSSSGAKRRAVRAPSPPHVVQYRGDAGRTGVTDAQANPALTAERWQRPMEGPVRGLVYDRGAVYAGAGNAMVAVDAQTGEERWRFTGEGRQFSPAAIDGTTLFTTAGNILYALDAATGNPRWQFDAGANIASTTPLLVDGVAYVGSTNGTIHAVDIVTHIERWRRTGGSSVRTHLTAAGGRLLAVTNGALRCLSLANGDTVWTRSLAGGADWTEVAADEQRVYAGAEGNDFYALDVQTGANVWIYRDTDSQRSGWSAPVIAGGTVYAGNRNRRVFAFDTATGVVRWRTDTAEAATSDAVLAGDVLYFGVGAHGATDDFASLPLYALRASDGTVLAAPLHSGHILGGVTVGGGAVYWHSSAGVLSAVE